MTETSDPGVSGAARSCLGFIEGRCGAHVSVVPAAIDEAGIDEATTTGPAVLSLFELDFGTDLRDGTEQDFLVVLALGLHAAGSDCRVVLRFVSRSAIRSAGRAVGTRWVANDIRIPTPPGLEEVSLLAYRIRRTPRLERLLAAIEDLADALRAVPDDENRALARAVLDRLEVLDGDEDAGIVLGGCGLRIGERAGAESRDTRYLALLGAAPGALPIGRLWLQDRKLLAGPERASAKPLDGLPYALLRFGAQSTQQSVSELIDKILSGAGETSLGALADSFAALVDRQVDERRKDRAGAMFQHHNMLPVVTPIAIEAASNLLDTIALVEDPPSRFRQLLLDMRASIEQTYGLRVPGIRVRANEDIPDGTYIIILEEIPLVSGKVDPRKLLCLAPVAQLPHPGREGEGRDAPEAEPATVPDGSDRAASWIPLDWADKVHAAGLETWDAAAYIEAHLRSVIVNHLDLLAHLDEIEGKLAGLDGADAVLSRCERRGADCPASSRSCAVCCPRGCPVTPICRLAQRYLALADGPTVEASEEMRLAPAGRAHLTRDLADWRIFTLDEAFEAVLQKRIIREGDGAVLALQPELTQKLLTAVKNLVQPARKAANGMPCVLVVEDWRARPFVRSLLVLELPWLRVVARREIEGLADVPVPLGRVAVAS